MDTEYLICSGIGHCLYFPSLKDRLTSKMKPDKSTSIAGAGGSLNRPIMKNAIILAMYIQQ